MRISSFIAISIFACNSALAEDFPPKDQILSQIRVSLTGLIVLRWEDRPPPIMLPTVSTTTSTYSRGFSQSNTVTTPIEPVQQPTTQELKIYNNSIYDIKDLTVECAYLAESGTPLISKAQIIPSVFRAGGKRLAVLMDVPVAPGAQSVKCTARDFEYMAMGVFPRLDSSAVARRGGNRSSGPWISDVKTEPGVKITDGFGNPLRKYDY
jgi:hypothetical protein